MSLRDFRFEKTKNWSRPHNMQHSWFHSVEKASQNATIYPLVMYDEGLGNPGAYEAHRENAAFVQAPEANCFPESRIDFVVAKLEIYMAKAALETDGLHSIKVGFMPIMTSFEDLTVIDELSTLETQDVLELTSEDTDNQAFPLYNDTKLTEKFANSALLSALAPGLTTTQVLEGVAFDENVFYNALHFLTISGKIKTMTRGLKWITLTRNKPYRTIFIKLSNRSKRMVKKSFFGVLIDVPGVDGQFQLPVSGDTTVNLSHVGVSMQVRYNEWNQEFDMRKVSS